MFTQYAPRELLELVNQLNNCEDILLNLLVSDITKFPPIKVTQRKAYKESMLAAHAHANRVGGGANAPRWQQPEHFAQRQVGWGGSHWVRHALRAAYFERVSGR